jgi:hypothetical protein
MADGQLNKAFNLRNMKEGQNFKLVRTISQQEIIIKEVKEKSKATGLSSSISQLTTRLNEKLQKNLCKFNNLRQHKYDEDHKIDDADTSEMIDSIHKKLRTTSYQLSTLVTDGKMHVQLFNGISTNLELLEGLPTYCKISSRREIAPAKVSIEY